jgi:hypothetical protein
MSHEAEDVEMHQTHLQHHQVDEEVKQHLAEAERNKLLNA